MELIQTYSESGVALTEGATGKDILEQGLLHGAVHVWMWRSTKKGFEVLLQRRSETKLTWPGLLDISAVGHIDLGEDPATTAVRETEEELNLVVSLEDLRCFGVHRATLHAPGTSLIENEFQWLYLLQLDDVGRMAFLDGEVQEAVWKPGEVFINEVQQPEKFGYVPHSELYFRLLTTTLQQAVSS